MRTILRGIVGSVAYGLNHAESDTDRLAIHQRPTEDILGLSGPSALDETLVIDHPEGDLSSHELGKAIHLLLKANPTCLEILYLDSYDVMTAAGYALLDIREAFLSKRMCATYGGYAKAQAERLVRRGDGTFSSDTAKRSAKHARHLCRLMLQGTEALQTGRLRVRLDADQIALCRKAEVMGPEELLAEFSRLDALLKDAAASSHLPEEPDTVVANELLITLRRNDLH